MLGVSSSSLIIGVGCYFTDLVALPSDFFFDSALYGGKLFRLCKRSYNSCVLWLVNMALPNSIIIIYAIITQKNYD